MKTRSRFFFIITLLAALLISFGSKAQSGALKGKVIDNKTKEPIPFASVVIEKDGKQITGTAADIDGNYIIDQMTSGIYDIRAAFIGYNTLLIKNIEILNESISINNLYLFRDSGGLISCPFVFDFYPPLISRQPAPSGQTITSEEIKRMPW
jgi:hypothetical protein